jgi:hypothetical protein
MIRLRRIATVFWFALALLIGQHAAALHDLGHATEQFSQKKHSRHIPASCDKCFACAELSGAAGASTPAVAIPAAANEVPVATNETGVACAPRLAFRSRAPPTLL